VSIGELATDSGITIYVEPKRWTAGALRAMAMRTGHAEGTAAWQGDEIDAYVADDRSQWWEQRWLNSYRTVLIQRSQTLQRTLNNLYSQQLAGALFQQFDRDPNYSMAHLPRMGRDPSGIEVGPVEGVSGSDASLFSMDLPFAGGAKARKDQDPISYGWGQPGQAPPPLGFITGPDWTTLEQQDYGAWISRQYRAPDMPFEFPNPLDYFHWTTANDLLAPSTGRINIGLGYFDLAGFVSALFAPLLYPMFFQRMETYAHSEVGEHAIDATAVRSDYTFKMKTLSDFPVLGPAMGGAIGLMSGVAGIGLPADSIAQSLDLLLRPQPWISAPAKVETQPGAFFATTAALQDWGLQDLDYTYFAAARYQQEAIDTDMLVAFRKAGSSALKLVINSLLMAAPPIKALTMLPLASTIFDAVLTYATENLTNMLLRPMRDLIELDTQYDLAGHPEVEADNSTVYHVGDTPGLFGLGAPWEPAGFAAGYGLERDATNRTEINQVEILTKRHSLSDIWDGQGLASQQHDLERQTFEGVSSRVVAIGMQAQTPLNLADFRTQVHTGKTTGTGLGQYVRKDDSYALGGTSLLGSRIQVGSDVLNPSFGGGVRMTDLDTTRLDTFFHGSIAFAPRQGDFTDIYDPAALPPGQPDAPAFDPDSGLLAAQAGMVTFAPGPDGITRYAFAPLAPGADGRAGLRVTYRGQDALMADGTTPQHIADARHPDHYAVTDRNGQPLTATVITGQLPAKVTTELPDDWTGPADPLVTVPPRPGVVDLDLGARVRGAPQQAIRSARDTDSGTINATGLTFLAADAIARLRQAPALLGAEGAPGTGDFQVAGNPATDFGNLDAAGNAWLDWHFVGKGSGDDYNRDGSIQAGSLATNGNQSVVEAPSPIKEAVHHWSDLVRRFVPESFRRAQPILSGNDAKGRPYAAEAWNTAYLPDAHILRETAGGAPVFVSNTPMGYSAASPPPANAINPYFWSGSDGYQYLTIWDGARTAVPNATTDAQRQQNGLPDPAGLPPAQVRAVLRIRPGTDTIEVLGDGAAVLVHRETQVAEVPADLADAMFADLLARGFTQGRAEQDTGVTPLYDRTLNPQASPPLGTPGDFTIIAGSPGGGYQVSFTRPYDGLVTVPPNRDGAGNPVSEWWTVNGWHLAGYDDPNPAQNWSGSPAGRLATSDADSQLIWAETVPGGQDGTTGRQLSDRITVAKTLTVGAPDGSVGMTGAVMPGVGIEVTLTGANTGPADASFQPLAHIRSGTTSFTIDTGVAYAPDRFSVSVVNANGTVGVPALKVDAGTGERRPETAAEAVGMATVTIPSDLLTGGDNTIRVEVQKGGIYQRFCRSEPPADPTDPLDQLDAGYWVNGVPVVDRDGTTWPAGNLFYENRMVGDGTGRYSVFTDSDVIHFNSNPFGPGVAGLDFFFPVEVKGLGWQPDSYDPDRGFEGQLFPLLLASTGGYQLKADIRAGVSITTNPSRQTLNTYALETVERYRYDPATQTVRDVLPPVTAAQTVGPLWTGGPVGHRTPPAIMPPSDGQRNAFFQSGAYVSDDPVTSGQNPVARATVGQRIDRTNRQVFGSDDNQLVRYLYAAMKPIDLDGDDEDRNGNGVLDPGEDGNGDGILQMGRLAADGRLYREYRDAFNMGYLDHLTIVGSANAATGGSITSTVEVHWRRDAVSEARNDYRQNYEAYASDDDRRRKHLTTRRRADLLMASHHAHRPG
jgi:hypothetical protein